MDVVTLNSQVSSYYHNKLSRGTYTIKFKNEKGTAFTVKKLIKE